MSQLRRQVLLLLVLLTAVAGAAGWCYRHAVGAHAATVAARSEWAQCIDLQRQIQALRQSPSIAVASEIAVSEIAQHVEQAAKRAGMPTTRIERIMPEAAQRVGRTDYQEKAVHVSLREVSFKHAVSFLHYLTVNTNGLYVKRLLLKAPRAQDNADRWNVQAVVAHLILQPAQTHDQ